MRATQPQPQTYSIALGNLNELSPETFDTFAGTVSYRTSFKFPHDPDVLHAELDLGDVWETAQLFVNGRDLGVKICPPYRYPVSSALQRGGNTIEVRVTNTLHSEIRDPFSGMRIPFGIPGPVRLVS